MRRGRAWWCLALLAACSEPTVPSRSDSYRFDAGGDVFHWPADRLPVHFYAQPTGNLRFLTRRAIDVWAGVFLYGEFTGEVVSDSGDADVIVYADSAPDVPPDPGQPVYSCTGETTDTVDVGNRLTGPIRVRLSVLSGTEAQVAACLRRTAIHEIGHALGLLLHSPNPDDIMWAPSLGAPLVVDAPTERDRHTAEVLYHTPATILPYVP